MSNKFTREAIPALAEKVKEQADELAAMRANNTELTRALGLWVERTMTAEKQLAALTARAEAAEARCKAALAFLDCNDSEEAARVLRGETVK